MKNLQQEKQNGSHVNRRLQQAILKRYASLVTSGNRGAVLQVPENEQ